MKSYDILNLKPRHKFWQMVWNPPIVGVPSSRKEVEERWIYCYDLTLKRFAFLVFEELQNALEGSLLFSNLNNV